MLKKVFFILGISSIVVLFIACGGGGSSSSSSVSSIFTVERGAVINAVVTDAKGQVATSIGNTNEYEFANEVTYPVTVSGGFIDIDRNGIKNGDDLDLDFLLITYEGSTITLLSTIIANPSKTIRDTNIKNLSEKFSISSDDLLLMPSKDKKTALLSNLIFKELQLDDSLEPSEVLTKIDNNELNIQEEFIGVDLTSSEYANLTPEEFLKLHESKIVQNISSLKNTTLNLPKYTGPDITAKTIVNLKSAYISAQCYTKTEDIDKNVHNPCYSCHINSEAPNFIDDFDLQESYAFSENSKKNPFTNSFKDRTSLVAKINDEEILSYINEDNYKDGNGNIILQNKLKYDLPKEWDFSYNGSKDGKWSGYTPDCYFNFDDEGFDKDKNGNYTGWRAFGYTPFLGTFWPTNGSTDDVLIRLPSSMMQDSDGNFSKEIYKINLAIVESMIKKEDIAIDEVNENDYGVDLNHNGTLEKTTQIVFKWNTPDTLSSYPKVIYKNYYVGLAKKELEINNIHISPGLYPNGTEFLHSVRYIGIKDDKSGIKLANRMKELRYAKKTSWNNYTKLNNAANAEIKEKDAFPDRLRTISGNSENGLDTGLGWVYQGFIEDIKGNLRPQSYEETLSCIGCHSGIGAIIDSTFAFPRKDNNHNQGWYHWSQKDLVGLKDRILKKGKGEFAYYLEQNKAGDEFRANDEIKSKFFDGSGALISSEVEKIKDDITYLIYPSVSRAITLNKAYKVIVDEQSYIYGKDAHVEPLDETVHKELEIDKSTGITPIKH